jgi:hypothetical protein
MPSRLASIVAAAAAIMLLTAAPALAGSAYYTVTGTGDDAESSCAGTAPDFTCPTLRAAVDAANLNPGYDAIFLDATGTYQLLRVLSLNDDVEIIGQGLRDTTLHGDGTDRVLTVAPGVSAGLYALTVANGYAADSDGGNILNRGSLWLDQVQVTRGRAGRGGGVYTVAPGDLEIYFGLVNDNTGGGIVNAGTSTANADFYSASSTFAFNTDGGIVSTGANSTVELVQVTLARNTGVGLSLESGQYSYLYGNILSDNSLGNCAAAQPPYDGGYNVENGTSCELTGTGSLNADPRLDAQLSNAGGWSDVLTIPADSRAVDLVANCYYSIDQRGFERVTSYPAPCDAGAYEQSAQGPPVPAISSGPS